MKRQANIIDHLERLIGSVYRGQETTPPGADWNAGVMAEIRRMGRVEAGGNGEALFGRFAWRFAAAACFVAAILLVYVFSNGVVDYEELAMRFLENPIDFII